MFPFTMRHPGSGIARGAFILTMVALVAIQGLGVSATRVEAASVTRAPNVKAIDAYLQKQVKDQGLPGLAYGIVHGKKIVHVRGFGKADEDGRPVTPQTPFILASTSKPLTALAVMQLVDAGKVKLDAPVQRYLPWFRVADPKASARITVRELLNHTSGIPNSACEWDGLSTIQQYVRKLRDTSLDRPVGSRHVYCSGNYSILGAIIGAVSGESYTDYMQRHVFAAMQMHHSFAREAPAKRDGLAQGYVWFFGKTIPMSYYNPSDTPAGYLSSSAEDMTHWLSTEMNGGRYGSATILSPHAIKSMWTMSVPADDGTRYGLGWQIGKVGGVPAYYHYGNNYHNEAVAFIEPQTHWGAIILINSNGILSTDAMTKIDEGVARMVAGRAPGPGVKVSVPTLYLMVDIVLLILTALVILPLARLRQWLRGLARRRRAHRRFWLVRAGARALTEIAVAVFLVVAVYVFFNGLGANSWSQIVRAVPDLVLWILAVSTVMALTGVLRAVLIVLEMRHSSGVVDRPAPSAAPRESALPV